MLDIVIVVFGSILLLIGILGCILPVLPGPIVSYAALFLLLLHDNAAEEITSRLLLIDGLAVLAVIILDYYMPIWGTKKFGGTNAGKTGSIIGLIAGIFFLPTFFGPIAIIIGPFLGAIAGELLTGQGMNTSLRSGIGSFLGFAAGTALKLVIAFVIVYHFIEALL